MKKNQTESLRNWQRHGAHPHPHVFRTGWNPHGGQTALVDTSTASQHSSEWHLQAFKPWKMKTVVKWHKWFLKKKAELLWSSVALFCSPVNHRQKTGQQLTGRQRRAMWWEYLRGQQQDLILCMGSSQDLHLTFHSLELSLSYRQWKLNFFFSYMRWSNFKWGIFW